MFHIFLLDTEWLGCRAVSGSVCCDVPNLAELVGTHGGQHVRDVWAESGARARLFVGLDIEDGIVDPACIETDHVTTFSRYDEVELAGGVPLCALNVLIDVTGEISDQIIGTTSNVHHVDSAVITSGQQDLLVFAIPAHYLYFIAVSFSISHLRDTLIKIPYSHRVIS